MTNYKNKYCPVDVTRVQMCNDRCMWYVEELDECAVKVIARRWHILSTKDE